VIVSRGWMDESEMTLSTVEISSKLRYFNGKDFRIYRGFDEPSKSDCLSGFYTLVKTAMRLDANAVVSVLSTVFTHPGFDRCLRT
jgi:hypothetical protein